jgi:hypothetical protein
VFLGLDISSLSTGVVVLDDTDSPAFQGTWKPPADLDYIGRGSWQAEKLLALLGTYEITRVAIEGYSLGSANRAEPLITVGTILRYFLRQSGFGWTEVAPSRLKKYAGAKLKEDMKVKVFKQYGFE